VSRVQGARTVKRLFKAIEPAMREEITDILTAGGRDLLAAMKAKTPVKTGALRGALSYKVYPNTLRLRVGLLGKKLNRHLFYARILEFGRKAQDVQIKRRVAKTYTDSSGVERSFFDRRKRSVISATYTMRVPRILPHRTIFAPNKSIRETMRGRLKLAFEKVLAHASRGAGGND
jgi:hypothetical protein